MTIMIGLGIIAYLVPTIWHLFADPHFNHMQTCKYNNFLNTEHESDENLSYVLDSLMYNLPFELTKNSTDGTPSSSLVRLQYFITTREEGDENATETYVNTTTCEKLF